MEKIQPPVRQLDGTKTRSGFSLRDLRTLESLKNPYYRFYYCSMVGQWPFMSVQMVTQSLLVYRLTGSGVLVGTLSMAMALPLIFFSFPGGVIADRLPKKFLMIAGPLVAATMAVIMISALMTGYLSKNNPGSLWLLILAAAVQGTIMGATWPASQSMLREIVSAEQLTNAVSLQMTGGFTFQLIGPTLAGFLIDGYGFHAVYVMLLCLYLFSAISATFLPRNVPTDSKRHPVRDMLEGLAYVRREPRLFQILVFAVFGSFLAMPYTQILPIFTEDVLKVGASGLGVLVGAAGLGALVGSLVFASLPAKRGGIIFIFTGISFGVALLTFSLSRWWYLSLAVIVLVGLSHCGKVTLESTLLQRYSDAAHRGRVLGLLIMQIAFTSVGTFINGLVAQVVGMPWAGLAFLAGTLLLLTFIMWNVAPQLKSLD